MPRALSVSKVTVLPEHEAEYLSTIQRLSVLADRRGQHVWVFRSVKQPHTFLEFSESPSEMSHRSRASRTGDELKLELRLQAIATYAQDAWELWEEIAAPASKQKTEGWEPEEDEGEM